MVLKRNHHSVFIHFKHLTHTQAAESITMDRKRHISQLDEINEPSSNATIHAAITNISPIKKGRLNTQFFDATLADTTSSVRLVGFSSQHQIQLSQMHKSNAPVELTNCVLKNSRQGQGFDVMLKSNTQIKKSPKKFDMHTIMASTTLDPKPITLNELQSLSQYDKVSVKVKVLQVLDIEEVGQEQKKKRDVYVADSTATAKVVLWEQHVNSLEEGNSYQLQNFYVKEFKAKKHLSIPKNDFQISQISDLEDTVDDIPKDDEYITLHNAQVIGVAELDTYRACLNCKARVEPQTPPLGKCSRDDCLMIQLFELCPDQISARVMLQHVTSDGKYNNITCAVYGDFVYQLANLPKNHPLTKVDILKPHKFHEVHVLKGRNIISFILGQK